MHLARGCKISAEQWLGTLPVKHTGHGKHETALVS